MAEKSVKTTTIWTDEKHMHFLNSIEASFVRSLFGQILNRPSHRLDRYLPDSSDSTLDSAQKRRRLRYSATTPDVSSHRRRKTRKFHTPNIDQDQVVPQMKSKELKTTKIKDKKLDEDTT